MDAPLALYRRYRPETFAEVIGQEHVTDPLCQALRNNRVNHAYLFSGPRGCGKTTSARILARCLNCAEGPTPDPCGRCQSCTDLARGGPGSIDVIEIDAASHGGVDDARDLRERAFFAPVSSRYKIYIVDEAHMVTPQGFNALLKLVEEPPDHLKFVFATTEPDKVIGTIRSRTHHYPFRLAPPKLLQDYLGQLCARESVSIEPAALPLVVRSGGGSFRDSLSVLDQLIGAAGPDGVTYQRAAALLGHTPEGLLDAVVDAFAAVDGAEVFGTVDKVIESGRDPKRFGEDLLRRLRDLLVVANVPDAGAHGLLDGGTEQVERLTAQAARFGRSELSRAADVVSAGLTEMRGATAPRLQLELICARVLLPGADDSEQGLHARIDRVERRMAIAGASVPSAPGGEAGVAPAPAVTPATPTQAAPVSPPAAPAAPPAAPSAASSASGPVSDVAAAEPSAASAVEGRATPTYDADEPSSEGPAAEAGSGEPAADAGSGEPAGAGAAGEVREQPSYAAEPGAPATGSALSATAESTAAAESLQPSAASASEAPVDAAPAPPAADGGIGLHEVRQLWPNLLERVKTKRRFTWIMLSQNAQVADVTSGTLVIALVNPGARDSFARSGSDEILRQALQEEIGVDWRIEAIVDAGSQPDTRAGGASSPPRQAAPPAGDTTPPSGPATPPSGPAGGTDAGASGPSGPTSGPSASAASPSVGDSSPEGSAATRAWAEAPAETSDPVQWPTATAPGGVAPAPGDSGVGADGADGADGAAQPMATANAAHQGIPTTASSAAANAPASAAPSTAAPSTAAPSATPSSATHGGGPGVPEAGASAPPPPWAQSVDPPPYAAEPPDDDGPDGIDPESDAPYENAPLTQTDLLARELGAQIIEDRGSNG